MAKVTVVLAHPWEKHAPGDQIDVAVDTARDLVQAGYASYATKAAALLFGGPAGSSHVAISRGDGTTIEARGVRYGVNNFPSAHRPWTAAGLVPGLLYDALPAAPIPSGARRMDERDQQTHDALGRTEALVGRLMRHAGIQPQPGPAVPPGDGLQQSHDAAARLENDVAALVQKLGA